MRWVLIVNESEHKTRCFGFESLTGTMKKAEGIAEYLGITISRFQRSRLFCGEEITLKIPDDVPFFKPNRKLALQAVVIIPEEER